MVIVRPVAFGTLVALSALWLGAIDAPALAQDKDQAAATGEARCPAGGAFSISGQAFGPGDVTRVETQFSDEGMPLVEIELSDEGQARFVALQDGRVGDRLPICLDGALLSDPYLTEPITGPSLRIAGGMTARETLDLAKRIQEQLGLKGKTPPSSAAPDYPAEQTR
jgi:preprotein translocase subunit SecD